MLHQATRALEFARHMPPGKLVRRLHLDLRRHARDRFGAHIKTESSPAPPPAQNAPQPLFPPRRALMRSEGETFVFKFIGREIALKKTAVDWRAPGPGSGNQLLRMNLHYMEYLEDATDADFQILVSDWRLHNPGNAPGVWRDSWNSYALSLRTVVWMQQLARRHASLPRDFIVLANDTLAQQFRFLERNLETDLGGNHLIKNIKALLWASAYFTGDEATRWRALGLKLLAREIRQQVLPDGFHYERSPSYHAQVFADLLECRQALGHDPLDGTLNATLSRMAQVLADMTHPDGSPALFNDAGLTMAYAPAECLAAYASLLAPAPPPNQSFAFPQAGYFGLRQAGSYLVADCGPIAPDDLPAHGHGDILSFEWSVADKRIIVDQGVFEYVAGSKRQQSRAASSHNTLSLEDCDQADFFGAFRCGRRPRVTVRQWQPAAEGFVLEGSHDGYAHLTGAPVHVRRFDVSPHKLVITDWLEGTTEHRARLSFLLQPDVTTELVEAGAILTYGSVRIRLTSANRPRIEPAVWWPDMGQELPTSRLILDLGTCLRESVVTFEVE